jgi:hypothetical protein
MNFAFKISLFHTLEWFFTYHKILQHAADGFTSPLKEEMLRIFIVLKNPLPWLGMNLWTLGPMTSMLTIVPPRQQAHHLIKPVLYHFFLYCNSFFYLLTCKPASQIVFLWIYTSNNRITCWWCGTHFYIVSFHMSEVLFPLCDALFCLSSLLRCWLPWLHFCCPSDTLVCLQRLATCAIRSLLPSYTVLTSSDPSMLFLTGMPKSSPTSPQ